MRLIFSAQNSLTVVFLFSADQNTSAANSSGKFGRIDAMMLPFIRALILYSD